MQGVENARTDCSIGLPMQRRLSEKEALGRSSFRPQILSGTS